MNKKLKPGVAFSDFVYKTESRRQRIDNGSADDQSRSRVFLLPLVLFLCLLLLIGRLIYLQLIKGKYYRALADLNRTRTTFIHAQRGIIFDRNGTPLVYNTPGYRKTLNGKPVFIDQKTAMGMIANGDRLEIDSLRFYPFKDALSHVLGYIGQVNIDDLHNPIYGNKYSSIDVIGKMGIESKYERLLRGTDGKILDEVDALGKKIRTLGQTDPVPGSNITLTIDSKLQQAVFDSTSDVKRGSVIVSKPDGEILAMVSRPSFDPNLFTMGQDYTASSNSYQTVEQILADNNNQPFLNRAISGTYPPGSTFKVIVAAAGLESGKINKDYTVMDNGILKIGNFSFSNWYYTQYGKTEGSVDIIKAIKRSNDIYFYTVGALVGVDTISSFAKNFGLGNVLGIDLPGEAKGLLPTKDWKQKTLDEQWYLGDDYHYGIGQGYLLTTPLQVNAWTQAIANGGVLYQPYLLQNQKSRPKVKSQKLLSKENFNLIKEGMVEACSTGGVAWPLFNFPVSVACKTGTAQHGGDQTPPHAWITLFAPANNPQIVVTILAEDSGEGSNVAGPIAKKILESYFGNKQISKFQINDKSRFNRDKLLNV